MHEQRAETLWVFGQLVRILVDGAAQNGGQLDLVEITLWPDAVGSPVHRDPWTDSTLVVLEGHVVAHLDDVAHELWPGDELRSERNASFGWRAEGDRRTRALICSRPSGAARLYRLLGTPMSGESAQAAPSSGSSRPTIPLVVKPPTDRAGPTPAG